MRRIFREVVNAVVVFAYHQRMARADKFEAMAEEQRKAAGRLHTAAQLLVPRGWGAAPASTEDTAEPSH